MSDVRFPQAVVIRSVRQDYIIQTLDSMRAEWVEAVGSEAAMEEIPVNLRAFFDDLFLLFAGIEPKPEPK